MLNGDRIAKLQQQSSSVSKKEDIEEKLSYVLLVVAHCYNKLRFPVLTLGFIVGQQMDQFQTSIFCITPYASTMLQKLRRY